MTEPRVVVWFSCGAASAVALKLASDLYAGRVVAVYCDMSKDEHPDNARFLADVERWTGITVERIRNEKFESVDDVFEKRHFMSSPYGAICTAEMKKVPRFAFQRADDLHIFGLTADEGDRIEDFASQNFELLLAWPLRDAGITKDDCYLRIMDAGIALPALYRMGYDHNNCIGCVKASSPGYWDKIRRDFPEVFAKRAAQSRAIGCQLVKLNGKRAFLDEMPQRRFKYRRENLSCGPDCSIQLSSSLEGRGSISPLPIPGSADSSPVPEGR